MKNNYFHSYSHSQTQTPTRKNEAVNVPSVPEFPAPQGSPKAAGQYAGVGFQVVVSNGTPRQLVGTAKTYQVSVGVVVFGGTVAYSRYPNGVYRLSFTPCPALPASASIGVFYKENVDQTTRGFVAGPN